MSRVKAAGDLICTCKTVQSAPLLTDPRVCYPDKRIIWPSFRIQGTWCLRSFFRSLSARCRQDVGGDLGIIDEARCVKPQEMSYLIFL